MNVWDEVLETMRADIPDEDFRRFFGQTAYASDAGDQLTVWVPTESIRRHISAHYESAIERALKATGRGGTLVRFVVTGGDDDDDE
jgi:chromosomal replication initiation ATPase DnaA